MAAIIVVAALSVGFAVDRVEKITEDEAIMHGNLVMINASEAPQAQVEEQRNIAAENAVTLYLDEKKSEYGVIDLQTGFVVYSSSETHRVYEQWRGSDAATQNGWTDEYLAANLAIVYAEYTVEYDNTKVPTDGGDIRCYFYLIRDLPDSDYRIWTVSYDVGDSHSRMP
jgi:hypothetical protein